MLGIAITLIVVGLLSFVLPLLGRQFVLITLLGFSGMGTFVAGFVFLVVGVVLLFTSTREIKTPEASPSAKSNKNDALLDLKRNSLFSDGIDGNIVTEKAFVLAQEGNVDAQVLVASAYLSGSNGLPQDPKASFYFFHLAAQQGHGFSCFVLAALYADGLGITQDFDNARIWALEAKKHGVANSEQLIEAIDHKRRA